MRLCVIHAGVQNHAGFFDKMAVKAALQRARVVFTTCAGAGSSQILLQQYALVVVDEASQVLLRVACNTMNYHLLRAAAKHHHLYMPTCKQHISNSMYPLWFLSKACSMHLSNTYVMAQCKYCATCLLPWTA